jgi:hypothetical protein
MAAPKSAARDVAVVMLLRVQDAGTWLEHGDIGVTIGMLWVSIEQLIGLQQLVVKLAQLRRLQRVGDECTVSRADTQSARPAEQSLSGLGLQLLP